MAVSEILSLIGGVVGAGMEMAQEYIDDPKRRLKAVQEYLDKCRAKGREVLNEKDMEALDSRIAEFLALIHEL